MNGPAPRAGLLAIAPYKPGEAQLPGVNRVVKLSSNEGAFGTPPAAAAAHARLSGELHRYPDGTAAALRRAIGARFGLDPERIVCGAGSDDLIYLLASAYGGPGTELVMTEHGFSIYEIAGRIAGSGVRKARERALTADVDAILGQVSPATRIVFLANPNNPTGSMIGREELWRLRRRLAPEVLLVIDAAYAEYVTRADYEAGAALVDAGANTVMTRTFSKIFGLGGMRLGWAYAPEAIVDVLNRVRAPFNVNAAVQEAGIAALAEPGWVEKSRAHNERARARLAAALTAAGIRVWPSEGNFLLADFATPERARAADGFLRGRGIIVRAVGGYGLPQALRITIGRD
ncbi:MAG: histidinol-phosphate transaminase, partial [Acetobacteraceae bacterium]